MCTPPWGAGGLWLCFLEGPPSPAFNEKAIPQAIPQLFPLSPTHPSQGMGTWMVVRSLQAGGRGWVGVWGGGGGVCRSVGGVKDRDTILETV